MNPDRSLGGLNRAELAVLVREYLLLGHLIDRAGMPHLIGPYGRDGMTEVAIDEWLGASPVYTRRMQRALGFAGTDVATIFKGMQLDIGAPPEFMDFRYTVHGPDSGEFELAHCGALMDVEPMGDEFVTAMCHHIEDPTFDATALATHAGARVRPLHRPPRIPADRHPHCHWTVEIDRSAPQVADPPPTVRMASTLAASVELADSGPDHSENLPSGSQGRTDYSGELQPDLRLGDFSHSTLLRLADEVCLQGHLLAMSFIAAIEERHGRGAAVEIGTRQFTGIAGLAADRLARLLNVPRDLDGVVSVLLVHPAFRPAEYVDLRVERRGDVVSVGVANCAGANESGIDNWIGLLINGADQPLQALVAGVDPRCRVARVEASPGELATWEITRGEEPQAEANEVTLARFSTGADFSFSRS